MLSIAGPTRKGVEMSRNGKVELVEALAQELSVTKTEAQRIFEVLFGRGTKSETHGQSGLLLKLIASGIRVVIPGFGAFATKRWNKGEGPARVVFSCGDRARRAVEVA